VLDFTRLDDRGAAETLRDLKQNTFGNIPQRRGGTYLVNTRRTKRMSINYLSTNGHTFVYWKVSCLPVNVAATDRGIVSVWHMPGAEHKALQECSCLEKHDKRYPTTRKSPDTPAKVTLVRSQTMKVVPTAQTACIIDKKRDNVCFHKHVPHVLHSWVRSYLSVVPTNVT